MTLSKLARAIEIASEARAYGQAIGKGDPGVENAARHAFWQAVTATELGNDVAQGIGDIHEDGQDAPTQPLRTRRDSWIDRYNNARARQIAAQCDSCTHQQLRDKLYDALRDNLLIMDNCDLRIPDFLRDCDEDGVPASEDLCDAKPIVPAQDGEPAPLRADVNNDGAVTIDDALQVMSAVGTSELENDVTGDCWIWVDDVNAVMEAVE
jgi:hypothetical protein